MFNYLYGDGYVFSTELKTIIDNGNGEIQVHVVSNGADTAEYGLFFKREDGMVFDVIKKHDFRLKSYKSAERLGEFLKKLGLDRVLIPLDKTKTLAPNALRTK